MNRDQVTAAIDLAISDEQIAAYEARARRNGERRTAQLCEQVLRERHDRARGLAEGVSRDEHELMQEIAAAAEVS